MKKAILFLLVIAIVAGCTKTVSKPIAKQSQKEIMRKRSNPIDDRKHY